MRRSSALDNFRASVVAKLNTDTQQIQETIYDPESKVERSVRATKENQNSQQTDSNQATTVEQNIPQGNGAAKRQGWPDIEGPAGQEGRDNQLRNQQQDDHDRRNSYRIDKLSVAVVVNKARVAKLVGEPADQAKIDAYVAEMQKIVATAAGLDTTRGDGINVTVMDFMENQILSDAAASGPGIMDMLSRNLGGIINSLAFIVVAFLVVWLGFRPLAKSMGTGLVTAGAAGNAMGAIDCESDSLGLELPDFAPSGVDGPGATLMDGFGSDFGFDSTEDLLMSGDRRGRLQPPGQGRPRTAPVQDGRNQRRTRRKDPAQMGRRTGCLAFSGKSGTRFSCKDECRKERLPVRAPSASEPVQCGNPKK